MTGPVVDRRGFLTGVSAAAVAAALPASSGATVYVAPLSTYVDPEVFRVIFELPPCRGFSSRLLWGCEGLGPMGLLPDCPAPDIQFDHVGEVVSRVVPGTERDNP